MGSNPTAFNKRIVMSEMELDEWKAHIKKIIVQNMKYSLEALSHDNLPDHVFEFMMRGLENGIEFLEQNRMEEKNGKV